MKATASARAILDSAVSEATFQQAVIDYLLTRCWRVNHNHDSRKSGPHAGLPDIIAARNGRVVFIELKKQSGRVSRHQQAWIDEITIGGTTEIYVFRPADWCEFERILF